MNPKFDINDQVIIISNSGYPKFVIRSFGSVKFGMNNRIGLLWTSNLVKK
jgi:hypothetical protein